MLFVAFFESLSNPRPVSPDESILSKKYATAVEYVLALDGTAP